MRARLQQLARRLWRAEDGAAAVEFALILPIMLALYVGSVETGALISMDRKLQSVTGAIGDLVARSDTTIPAATLGEYFLAAGGIMTPHSTENLTQVVTQVYVDGNGDARVVWSHEYHDGVMSIGTRHLANTSFELPDAMSNVSKNGYVIVAEGSYAYPPLYGFAFQKTINLYRENFFMPRFGGSITVQ